MSDERRPDAPNPNVIGSETDGRTGAVTGFDTPDPKDNHTVVYTTTPEKDRVGSADHGEGAPPEIESAHETTGKYDHLATRDVVAMEQALEAPEFAGAQTVAGLGGEMLDGVIPSAGLGINPVAALGHGPVGGRADQNPGYTPPSEKTVPHVRGQSGGPPSGEPTELQNELRGTGEDRH